MPEIMSFSINNAYWQKKQIEKKTNISRPVSSPNKHLQFAGSGDNAQTQKVALRERDSQDSFEGAKKRRKLDTEATDTEEGALSAQPEEEENTSQSESDDDEEGAPQQYSIHQPYPLMVMGNPAAAVNQPVNAKMLIKPLPEDISDLDAYKEVGEPFADKLEEITSRAFMHNAILKSNNAQMRQGILMRLKEKLGQIPMFSMDCSPTQMGRLPRDIYGSAFGRVFAEPADTLGLPKDTPTVLVLDNASPNELGWLKRQDIYQNIKRQNPNFRFIINGENAVPATSPEQQRAVEFISLFNQRQQYATPGPSGPAPFEEVNVPALNAKSWYTILHKDKQAQDILKHWKLDFPQQAYMKFLTTLISANGGRLEHHQILGELDKLGSFIRKRKKDLTPTINEQHVEEYKLGVQRFIKEPQRNQASNLPIDTMAPPYSIVKASDIKTKMEDVVGHDHAKTVLTSAMEMAKYPALYAHLDKDDPDARVNYVLLMGEPGGGKTMLARAIAGQGKATFISTTGSQFVNQLSGMGAANIRRLKEGIESAPDDLVNVFIDEIDGLGNRDPKARLNHGGNEEDVRTIGEFLVMLDGIDPSKKKILLIAATNRPHALDEAILRRFHHKIEIQKLDREQRKELLEKLCVQKGLKKDSSVDLEQMAKQTDGFRGSDLSHLMKIAKTEIVQRIPDEEKARLNSNPEALSQLELTLTNEILMKSLKTVKEGIKKSKRQVAPPPPGLYE